LEEGQRRKEAPYWGGNLTHIWVGRVLLIWAHRRGNP